MLQDIWQHMNTANEDYKNEIEYWLSNPQNTCDHSETSYVYVGKDAEHDYYDIVCNKCGKILDTYKD